MRKYVFWVAPVFLIVSSLFVSGKGPPSPAEIEKLRADAEKGDRNAQIQLGRAYSNGVGGTMEERLVSIERDKAEAAKWFLKAAEQGSSAAQEVIAGMFEEGRGVKKDMTEAARWLKKAAEQDDPDAQYKLGEMYGKGVGVERNLEEAFKWIRKAAEDEDQTVAQRALGNLYKNGTGVTKNETEAVRWFHKADDRERLVKKLNDIVIPTIEFEKMPTEKAIEFLMNESKRLDPDHQGVRIELHLEEGQKSEVDLNLKKVSLLIAIKFLTEQTGLGYRYVGDSVLIGPDPRIYTLETRTFTISADLLRTHLPPHNDDPMNIQFQKVCEDYGVEFPKGTSFAYDEASGLLKVTHTIKTLDSIKQILDLLQRKPAVVH